MNLGQYRKSPGRLVMTVFRDSLELKGLECSSNCKEEYCRRNEYTKMEVDEPGHFDDGYCSCHASTVETRFRLLDG